MPEDHLQKHCEARMKAANIVPLSHLKQSQTRVPFAESDHRDFALARRWLGPEDQESPAYEWLMRQTIEQMTLPNSEPCYLEPQPLTLASGQCWPHESWQAVTHHDKSQCTSCMLALMPDVPVIGAGTSLKRQVSAGAFVVDAHNPKQECKSCLKLESIDDAAVNCSMTCIYLHMSRRVIKEDAQFERNFCVRLFHH